MDETVKALLEQMKLQQEQIKIQQEQSAEQLRLQREEAAEKEIQHRKEMADMIASIKDVQAAPPTVNVQPAPLDQNAVRADKVQRLAMSMRKSNRVKPFKASGESDVQKFLKRFTEELVTLKQLVGINDDLSKEEYVPILRASLEFPIIEKLSKSLGKIQLMLKIGIPLILMTLLRF